MIINGDESDGMQNFELDKDQIPMIPRATVGIPKEIRHEFVQDMIDEVRQTPGELIVAILIKYYRAKRAQRMLNNSTVQPGEKPRIPSYGSKVLKSASDQDRSQTGE